MTREFLRQAAKQGVAEAPLARTYASVPHFARWIYFKVHPFPLAKPAKLLLVEWVMQQPQHSRGAAPGGAVWILI